MNRIQIFILILGIIVIVIMGLCPPVISHASIGEITEDHPIIKYRSIYYLFNIITKYRSIHYLFNDIFFPRLIVQWIITLIITLYLVVIVRNNH